jgi:hypothetical protein
MVCLILKKGLHLLQRGNGPKYFPDRPTGRCSCHILLCISCFELMFNMMTVVDNNSGLIFHAQDFIWETFNFNMRTQKIGDDSVLVS